MFKSRIVLLLFIGLGLASQGCAKLGIGKPPSWCDEPGRDSTLCRIAGTYDLHLETVGEIVAAVNLRALKEGLYEKDDATKVLRFLKDVACDGMDVGDFGEEVSAILNDVPEFMIVRPYLSLLTIQQNKVLKADDVAALGWYFDREIARVVRQ